VNARALSIFAGALFAGALLVPARAGAHAFPTVERPRVGATFTKPPSEVAITFDAPIESLFATLMVFDDAGHDETASKPRVTANRRQLVVMLKPLGPGDYTVKWAVLAEDGHRSEGSYSFTVAGTVAGERR
jgi:methionine-rich copper-binding protein CopC